MFPRERIILLYPKGNPMLQFLIKESKKYKDKEKLRRMIDFSTFLTFIKVLEYIKIVNKIRFGIKMISTIHPRVLVYGVRLLGVVIGGL